MWAASQAPADAAIVGVLRNLAEFETSLKALAGPEAESIAIIKMVEESLPPGAFDNGGPMVLIVSPGEKGMATVGMMRIKDESKLKGEDVGGGILKVMCPAPAPAAPDQPASPAKTVFVFKMAPWAVVGDSLEDVKVVASATAKLQVTDADRKAAGAHQVWIRLNPKSLSAAAKSALAEQKKATAAMGGGQGMPEMTGKMLDWFIGLLDQVQTAAVVVDIKPTGAVAEMDVMLADGSPLLAAAGSGMPIENFKGALPMMDRMLVIGWGRMDWSKAMTPMKTLVKPLMDVFTQGASDADRKAMDELWASYEQWGAVIGNEVAMVMDTAPPGKGMYRLAETFTIKDPAEFRKLFTKQMSSSMNMVKLLMARMGAMPGMPTMKMDVDYKEAAETIEGVPVDVMKMKMEFGMPPDAPPESKVQMKKMMDEMYGPEGMVMRFAVVDKLGVVTMGDPAMMAQAIQTAKGKAPDLSTNPKVAAAIARMPKGACMAGAVSLGNYVFMGMGVATRMMETMAPPEIQEKAKAAGLKPLEAPPMGDLVTFSGRLDGKTIHLTLDVPQSEVLGAITAAKQGGERMGWFMQQQQEMQQKAQPGMSKAAPAAAAETPAPQPEPAGRK